MKVWQILGLCVISCVLGDQKNPQPSDITYYLFTRSNIYEGIIIPSNGTNFHPFSASKKTYVVVHGFSETALQSSWPTTVKDLILAKDDGNVILVDWGILAAAPRYDRAASDAIFVGEDLSVLLHKLTNEQGLKPSDVYLIGFSLGAQTVGVTGNRYKTVGRITGLDPAAPDFKFKPLTERLDSGDAAFVDVIHTNSGPLFTGHLSFAEPLGHVDFYPDGGHDQRGCEPLLQQVVTSLENLTIDDIDACSHSRSAKYYIQSLKENDFIGYNCSNYIEFESGLCVTNTNILGWNARKEDRGTFYMDTLVAAPYVASQIETHFAIETSTKGSLVLKNSIPGMAQDSFEIFGGWGKVHAGENVTKIITASNAGVINMEIILEYEAGRRDPKTLAISAINAKDLNTNEETCIGKNLKLDSGKDFTVFPTLGAC